MHLLPPPSFLAAALLRGVAMLAFVRAIHNEIGIIGEHAKARDGEYCAFARMLRAADSENADRPICALESSSSFHTHPHSHAYRHRYQVEHSYTTLHCTIASFMVVCFALEMRRCTMVRPDACGVAAVVLDHATITLALEFAFAAGDRTLATSVHKLAYMIARAVVWKWMHLDLASGGTHMKCSSSIDPTHAPHAPARARRGLHVDK